MLQIIIISHPKDCKLHVNLNIKSSNPICTLIIVFTWDRMIGTEQCLQNIVLDGLYCVHNLPWHPIKLLSAVMKVSVTSCAHAALSINSFILPGLSFVSAPYFGQVHIPMLLYVWVLDWLCIAVDA
jgi:hypothetical protein